jgi:hypothetical protein
MVQPLSDTEDDDRNAAQRPGDRTRPALWLGHAQNAIANVRERLFEQFVFSTKAGDITSSKQYQAYRHHLLSERAVEILTIIWKESPYVSDQELASVRMSRLFPDSGMTERGLAIALADTPQDVSAANVSVRNLLVAGEAYGLVKRTETSPRRFLIEGTEFLHEFMIQLGEETVRTIQRNFEPRMPKLRGDAESQHTNNPADDTPPPLTRDWMEVADGVHAPEARADDAQHFYEGLSGSVAEGGSNAVPRQVTVIYADLVEQARLIDQSAPEDIEALIQLVAGFEVNSPRLL